MSDEFDDLSQWSPLRTGPRREQGLSSSRLVARLYSSADAPLRKRLLACLVRPLGSLALVAVAAGAFGRFLPLARGGGGTGAVEEISTFTNAQVAELARFVEQVSPQALHQFAALLSDSRVAAAAFGAATIVLLLRALPRATSTDRRSQPRPNRA